MTDVFKKLVGVNVGNKIEKKGQVLLPILVMGMARSKE